jgi:hypothetical protein
MFKKILIANRGESGREAGASAEKRASAEPECVARRARAGDFSLMETAHV